ncbi:MAG: ribosomal methyltransferase KsgA/Dim1 family protein [Geminicoccaceae bacterium]|nr:ribosomal methyltransferase KsgA/Dim1 family protein [Geminicoccaceae bacterium]
MPGRLAGQDYVKGRIPTVPAQRASRSEQILLFGRNFIKHPKMLGSLIPSSRFLVNKVLGEVDWDRARVFLEYGPGVGTFTTEILPHHPWVSGRGRRGSGFAESQARRLRYLGHSIHDHSPRCARGDPSEDTLAFTSHGGLPGLPIHPHGAALPSAGVRPHPAGLRTPERDAGPPVLLPAPR